MNLDDQIRRYFGNSNLAGVPPEALDAGVERMKVELGLTKIAVSGSHYGRCCTRSDRLLIWMPHLPPKQIVRPLEISWTSFKGRLTRSCPPLPG